MKKLFNKLTSMLTKLNYRSCGLLASLALVVTVLNANSACGWIAHQPKMPVGAEKFRKF